MTAVALVAMVGAAAAETPEQAKIRALEARVKKLEDTIAQNDEALDFLRKVYQQQKAQAAAADDNEPAPDAVFAVSITDNVKHGMTFGKADAAVTIVWAFDFADPYSHRSVPVMEELVATYSGKVRVVMKNMIVHPERVTDAHHAGCAAAKQKKWTEFWKAFWKFGFEEYLATRDGTKVNRSAAIEIAKNAGLDTKKLEADMKSKACKDLVRADMAELQKFRVNATPTFFVNGKMISGALPKAGFVQLIDDSLAVVKASKVPGAKYYDREVMGKGEKTFRSKVTPKP